MTSTRRPGFFSRRKAGYTAACSWKRAGVTRESDPHAMGAGRCVCHPRLRQSENVLKFEHVIVVNDADNPLVADLTRDQVWFGLMCRAEDPRPFLPGLDTCVILERSENVLVRALSFGQVVIHDEVLIEPLEALTFESKATSQHAGGSLRISIEEPAPGELILRFVYRTTLPESESDPDGAYAGFVKAAYHSSDLDTVRVIRDIAGSAQRH